jgi:hypothetical protein
MKKTLIILTGVASLTIANMHAQAVDAPAGDSDVFLYLAVFFNVHSALNDLDQFSCLGSKLPPPPIPFEKTYNEDNIII